MTTYDYYEGFLAFVQIAVALNFGFIFLDNKSILVRFQQGFFNWIKGLFRNDIEYAQQTYSRVRDASMPDEFVKKKKELKGLLSVFDTKTVFLYCLSNSIFTHHRLFSEAGERCLEEI